MILSGGYSEEKIADRVAGMDLAGFIQEPYRSASLGAILRRVLQ